MTFKSKIALQDNNKPIGIVGYQLLLSKEELQILILNKINASKQENE